MTFSRKFMDNLQHPRIDCTRAEYAEVFGTLAKGQAADIAELERLYKL